MHPLQENGEKRSASFTVVQGTNAARGIHFLVHDGAAEECLTPIAARLAKLDTPLDFTGVARLPDQLYPSQYPLFCGFAVSSDFDLDPQSLENQCRADVVTFIARAPYQGSSVEHGRSLIASLNPSIGLDTLSATMKSYLDQITEAVALFDMIGVILVGDSDSAFLRDVELYLSSKAISFNRMTETEALTSFAKAPRRMGSLIAEKETAERLIAVANGLYDLPVSAPTIRLTPTLSQFGMIDGTTDAWSLLLSAGLMLNHLGIEREARRLINALMLTVEEGIHTDTNLHFAVNARKVDTAEYADAVLERLGELPRHFAALFVKQSNDKKSGSTHSGGGQLPAALKVVS